VHARFTGAAPDRVFVEFHSAHPPKGARSAYLRTELQHGAGGWSGSLRVPLWLGDQTLQARVYAEWGRNHQPGYRNYDAAQLRRRHLPYTLAVVSGVDATRPVLTSISFSPSAIDSTNGAQQVTVTAQATDTGSGVRFIDVNGGIRHGINGLADGNYPHAAAGVGFLSSDDFHVRLEQSSNGDWIGTTTVRRCVPSGSYKLTASLSDAAGNRAFYSTKQLAKAGITSRVDVTSKRGDVVAPYVFSAATYGADSNLFLNFSEGVANVSTSTLTVYALSPKSTRFQAPVNVSAIACADGKDVVDCSGAGDLITSAKLTVPDLDPGTRYVVYANLDQVSPQLTDGNGNPMDWNYAATEVIDARSPGR
jgi:hypothetical protein